MYKLLYKIKIQPLITSSRDQSKIFRPPTTLVCLTRGQCCHGDFPGEFSHLNVKREQSSDHGCSSGTRPHLRFSVLGIPGKCSRNSIGFRWPRAFETYSGARRVDWILKCFLYIDSRSNRVSFILVVAIKQNTL